MSRRDIIKREDIKRWEKKYDLVPEELERGLDSRTFKKINNAYNAHVYIDEFVELWIQADKLHLFLNTTSTNAAYIVQNTRSNMKIERDGVEFIQMAELSKLIFKKIEQTGNSLKRKYLKFSEECMMVIREDDSIIKLRREYEDYYEKELRNLKNARIQMFDITKDELTGDDLDLRNSEFSHVRSKSMYPELALQIENGLIVNKATHDIITFYRVSDEDDLLLLCEKNNWDLTWYAEYKTFYR